MFIISFSIFISTGDSQKRNYHIVMFTEKEIRQNVGNIVKQLRMQKGLTQEKLAEFIDVQPQTIRSIEKAEVFYRARFLLNFLISLKLTIHFSF